MLLFKTRKYSVVRLANGVLNSILESLRAILKRLSLRTLLCSRFRWQTSPQLFGRSKFCSAKDDTSSEEDAFAQRRSSFIRRLLLAFTVSLRSSSTTTFAPMVWCVEVAVTLAKANETRRIILLRTLDPLDDLSRSKSPTKETLDMSLVDFRHQRNRLSEYSVQE